MDNQTVLYERREEPEVLRRPDGGYVSLPSCDNRSILKILEDRLTSLQVSSGEPQVISVWYTPPHDRILGYGIYAQCVADQLAERSSTEQWGSPAFGRSFTLEWVQARIRQITHRDTSQ